MQTEKNIGGGANMRESEFFLGAPRWRQNLNFKFKTFWLLGYQA